MKPEWWSALAGGALIGLSAALLLFCNRRTAGVSGILDGALTRQAGELGWRLAFLSGLALFGLVYAAVLGGFDLSQLPGLPVLAGAGLLVGFGTRVGGGCTSGHGICGIARGSRRSLLATPTFMLAAVITVYLVRHVP